MEVFHMFKKVTIFFVVVSVMAFSIAAVGAVNQQGKLAKVSDDEYLYTEGMLQHHLKVITNARGRAQVIDTLRWWGWSDDSYLNSGHPYTFPGDTVISDFKLIPDPAFLVEIRGIFGDGGQADFYVTDGLYGSEGQQVDGFGPNILANKTWDVVGSAGNTWETLDFSPNPDTLFLPWSSDPDASNRPHWVIGYICSGTTVAQGGGIPDIYYDYNSYWLRASLGGPGGHSWFTYNGEGWYGIVYTDDHWAQYVWDAVVNYYNGTSPFINSLSQLNNTWYTSNFASIKSEIVDIDGSVANAWLFYQTQNSSSPDSVTATSVDGNVYSFDIPGTFAAGDTITYWTKAEDNEGKSIVGMSNRFLVKAAQNPNAEVLVVYQNLDSPGGDKAGSIQNFWTPLLNAVIQDSLGMQYETWDVNDNLGIDRSVIDHSSFKTALAFGFGISNIPAQDWSTSDWKGFVESGKNLMIAAPDYLFDNNLPGQVDYTAVEGDFIYDVLGCGLVHNDPEDANGNSTGDEIVIGSSGDPISDPWFASPIFFDFGIFLGDINYNDFAENNASMPNSATVFLGVSSGRGNGVRNVNEWGGHTLFLPFSLSAIADSTAEGVGYPLPDAYELLKRYFDYSTAVGIDELGVGTPLSYELKANYPNPFNPSTIITYSIQKAGLVKLTVYNLLGEKVRSLVNTTQAPDEYHIAWDGKNDAGINVASGVYIYKLSAGNFSDSRKMILMK